MNIKIIPSEIGLVISLIAIAILVTAVVMGTIAVVLKQPIDIILYAIVGGIALFFAKRPFVR